MDATLRRRAAEHYLSLQILRCRDVGEDPDEGVD
jgi:hypothetical protein